MVFNATVSRDKLSCTIYAEFENVSRVLVVYLSRFDIRYMDVKFNVFKKDDNRGFCPNQKITTGESDFNQFLRLINELSLAAKNIRRDQNLSFIRITTKSKVLDE